MRRARKKLRHRSVGAITQKDVAAMSGTAPEGIARDVPAGERIVLEILECRRNGSALRRLGALRGQGSQQLSATRRIMAGGQLLDPGVKQMRRIGAIDLLNRLDPFLEASRIE